MQAITYPYRQRLLHIVGVILILGPTALFFAYLARNNYRGLVINGIFELSASNATVFYWGSCVFCTAIALFGVFALAFRFMYERSIKLAGDAIVVPTGAFSTTEIAIPFCDIQKLQLQEFQKHRFLHILHGHGKVSLVAAMFATDDAFQELCTQLAARVHAVSRPERSGTSVTN